MLCKSPFSLEITSKPNQGAVRAVPAPVVAARDCHWWWQTCNFRASGASGVLLGAARIPLARALQTLAGMKSKLERFLARNGFPMDPKILAALPGLDQYLKQGAVPPVVAAKLAGLKTGVATKVNASTPDVEAQTELLRNSPWLLQALREYESGLYSKFSDGFAEGAKYAISYLVEVNDLKADSEPLGYRDDCRLVLCVCSDWKDELGNFKLWIARQRVPLLWTPEVGI